MPSLADRLGFTSHLTVPVTVARPRPDARRITLVNGAGRRPFDDGDLITALDIGRRAGQALGNSWLYGEQRHVAQVLQHSMLPHLPVVPGSSWPPATCRRRPGRGRRRLVRRLRQPDGDLIAAIGDVAGHDIEAAAIMGQLRNLVRGNAYGRHGRGRRPDAPPGRRDPRAAHSGTSPPPSSPGYAAAGPTVRR